MLWAFLLPFAFLLLPSARAACLFTSSGLRAGQRDEREGRARGVVDDAEATDLRDVCRRHADLAAEFPDLPRLRVHVVHGDVGHPVRRYLAELRPHLVDAADR